MENFRLVVPKQKKLLQYSPAYLTSFPPLVSVRNLTEVGDRKNTEQVFQMNKSYLLFSIVEHTKH